MTSKQKIEIALFAIAAVAVGSASYAQPRGNESTAAQRQACTPDVYRLCKWYIPSHEWITYCLQKNIDRLSPDCRAVMEGRLR
jgi:hypothetical protein